METELITSTPVPVWISIMDEHEATGRSPVDIRWLMNLDRDLGLLGYRGVSLDRLATVLATGIDVEPVGADNSIAV